ncbi:hypothetical protein CBR_g8492 [Chara braunii]|uniref:Uncharacterized protein n=1 Tax=Chara braunii TaxID=69332 RepID=A0A388KMA7_CHABU|nr:hypothetical protein CBR_g8492 [Chara braunii]|eukprot:GBG71189.1 hypothetical protein CBR_g8492 [Chara braunii]
MPITDSRVIREEKAREDLLWDLDTIREQIEQEYNKEPSLFREALKQAELQTYKRRDKFHAGNKHQLQEGDISSGKESGQKRRRVDDPSKAKRTNTTGAGSEGEGMEFDLTGDQADDEADGKIAKPDVVSTDDEDRAKRSLTWLRHYVEKAKREREHAFDVRVACLKHAKRSQVNGKKDATAGNNSSSNQFAVLQKAKAEEFSEYAAFRYAEKKRAREQGTEGKDKTIPTTKDNFQGLRPKARKTGKNQKRRDTNNDQTEVEEKSERDILEKKVAVVLSQTEKLRKWNKEYAPEFTTITQIANGKTPMVVESAKAARITLRNIRLLVAARYEPNAREWQIATDIAFQIPHFVEGENVVKTLKNQVTLESPLGLFVTVAMETDLVETSTQEGSESVHNGKGESDRNSPRAFSPLIAKMSDLTQLRSGMIWRPWRTVAEVPYNILASIGVSAELTATAMAHIVEAGQLDGDEDLDARAYAMDNERFYRSDASDCSSWDGDEREKMDRLTELEKVENGQMESEGTGGTGSEKESEGTTDPLPREDMELKTDQEEGGEGLRMGTSSPTPT